MEAKRLRDAERLRQEVQIEKDELRKALSEDKENPVIKIESVNSAGKQAIKSGYVRDNVGIAEISVDGHVVVFLIRATSWLRLMCHCKAALTVVVQATDMSAVIHTICFVRSVSPTHLPPVNYARLNPIGKSVKKRCGLALIVEFQNMRIHHDSRASLADADAMMFKDYASEKLGIPDTRIKTMVNDNADIRERTSSV